MSDVPRILIVDDERHLADGLKLNFELEGFTADVAGSVREAGNLLVNPKGYDAIVLDVMLPDGSGFDLCRKLRDAGNFTPVIMLTARGAADDRVVGLESGADDYLPKPFELTELLARVRSLIRRLTWDRNHNGNSVAPVTRGSTLSFATATIDFDTHEVTVGGEARKLTQLELDLVRYFADNAGRVLSRAELLESVWGLGNYPNTRTVDNFVMRLRKHFEEDASDPKHFLSVRGAGYKFVPFA